MAANLMKPSQETPFLAIEMEVTKKASSDMLELVWQGANSEYAITGAK